MTKLEDIENAVTQLSGEERATLGIWLEALEERLSDEAIEHDAKAGKLDWLAEKAMAEHKAGCTRPLKLPRE